jgi:hypothetical protein
MAATPDPMGQFSLYGSFFGAINSAYGAYASARSTKMQLELQSQLADINAKLAESSAQQEIRRGQQAEQGVRLKTAQIKGSQRAAMAANGIDLGSDSATHILTTTDYMGERDAITVRDNATRNAWGYRTQGANYKAQALMDNANASAISPMGSGFGSLLTGAGTVAERWYTLNKSGALAGTWMAR